MKKTLKTLALTMTALSLLTGCSAPTAETQSGSAESSSASIQTAEGDTSYIIGIGQYAEHGSLDRCV